jgi:hypothetical protein
MKSTDRILDDTTIITDVCTRVFCLGVMSATFRGLVLLLAWACAAFAANSVTTELRASWSSTPLLSEARYGSWLRSFSYSEYINAVKPSAFWAFVEETLSIHEKGSDKGRFPVMC